MKKQKSIILAICVLVSICLQSTAKANFVTPVIATTVNLPELTELSLTTPPIMQPLTIFDVEQARELMNAAAESGNAQTASDASSPTQSVCPANMESRNSLILDDEPAMAIPAFARIAFEPLKPVTLGVLQDDNLTPPNPDEVPEETLLEAAPTTPDHSQPLLASVPLDAELQWQIFEISCKSDPDKFCLAMAVSNQESDFDPNCVYDSGDSWGMMQIQPKWHGARLTKYGLGPESLFDPINNVIIGLDYLEEIRDNAGLTTLANHQVLMSYNMGEYRCAQKMAKGVTSTDYSVAVMEYYQSYLAEFPGLQG